MAARLAPAARRIFFLILIGFSLCSTGWIERHINRSVYELPIRTRAKLEANCYRQMTTL